jgi:pimeloyl-ACP methyl ester carboxylesterase
MKKILLALCVLLVAAAPAAAGTQRFEGVLNDAPYKILVPDNWNGELLMYAHGYGYTERLDMSNWFNYSYADAAPDTYIAPNGLKMEEILLGRGYALAGTAFRGIGYQVKDGMHDLISLAGLFSDLAGKPSRTILIGYSMGGLMALKSAESVPIYDGIIAACAVSSGASKSTDLTGAFAMGYDVLFGWPPAWGKWYDVRNDIDFFTDVYPVLLAQLDPTSVDFFENIAKFEFLRVVLDSPFEGFYQGPTWVGTRMFFITQVMGELESKAKGPVVQNADHVYLLSDGDRDYLKTFLGFTDPQIDFLLGEMNARTTVTAGKPQRHYLAKYADITGDLRRPVVSIHSVYDGIANIASEGLLRDAVAAANKEGMLVQAFTDGVYHCGFSSDQLLSAIDAMEYWLDEGKKPGPEFFPPNFGENPGFLPPGYVIPPWPIGKK